MEELDFQKLLKLAVRLGLLLEKRKDSVAVAESCTGGWLSHILTSVPTSSTWFERGFVTYSNEAKISMLNVSEDTLQEDGPVSEQTAQEMSEGALHNSLAQVSVAITGLAGPESNDKHPVGTCFFAWSGKNFATKTKLKFFQGDRTYINYQAVEYALSQLLKILGTEK